jgi:DNA repair photolyase
MKQGCKKDVVMRERKSKFVEIFRTNPPKTVCPNFFVLAHANGCAFAPRCSYCYLKTSFRNRRKQDVFSNVEKMLKQAKTWIKQDDLESYVLNTGNLSDSLSFEAHRPLMSKLIELFRNEAEAKGRKHTLLMVTKGGLKECQVFFETKPCANVVISFSVNNPDAAKEHESGAPPIKERLLAARKLKKQGWRVRIRIDPMILGYDYKWITTEVKKLRPERVTLGTMRAEHGLEFFMPKELGEKLERPPEKRALARYPRESRLKLYRSAQRILGKICPMGLCEETKDIWDALGLDTEAKSCNCGA